MQTVSICASAIMTVAITAPASGAYAQDSKLSVPDVTVTALAGPFEPPYMRNPGKAYARNPYFGRYRVEEDQFPQVPCSQTRIAFSPGGNCLQGYRLTPAPFNSWNGSSTCDMALDVVIDTSGKLSIEADILVFDPYKVVANGGANPRFCYVNSYLGYDEEDFLDMNQVTRRGTNWHNLVVNDSQNQWYGGGQVEVHPILGWTTQLHRRSKARPGVARRLRLHDARQHLPHRHGSGASPGHRLCARFAANADLRPARQFEKGRRSNNIRSGHVVGPRPLPPKRAISQRAIPYVGCSRSCQQTC